MSCEEFWNEMPEFASGGNAEHEHVKECPQCAGLIDRQRRLALGLRTMANDWRAVAAPPRVEANLIDAFRREMTAAGPRSARMQPLPILTWIGAAAALMAMAAWLGPSVVSRRTAAPPAAHHAPAAAVELAALTDDAAYDDGFLPLPNTERVGPNDDVNVVRMELPRSAMLVVGLDVNPERVSETVEAEVMLGPDGLARAVRFVDGTN
jgi:hypothetical protein